MTMELFQDMLYFAIHVAVAIMLLLSYCVGIITGHYLLHRLRG